MIPQKGLESVKERKDYRIIEEFSFCSVQVFSWCSLKQMIEKIPTDNPMLIPLV